MISLSSIVKANTFYELKRSTDFSVNSPGEDFDEKSDLIIKQAIRKSQHIELEAKKRAGSIIESAQENAKEISLVAEQKGYQEGYQQGLLDGAKTSEKSAESGLKEIDKLIETIKAEQREVLRREEKDLLMIALEVAKKIMRQQFLVDETAMPKMLEEIVMENESGIKIYLSEYNKSLDFRVDKSIAKQIHNMSKKAKVVIVKQEDIIMVETESGMVDMSLPVQLEKIKDVLETV